MRLVVGMKVRWIMPDMISKMLIKRAMDEKGYELVLPKRGDVCTVTLVEHIPQTVRQSFPRPARVLGTLAVCVAEIREPGFRVPAVFVGPMTDEAPPVHRHLEAGMRVRCVLEDSVRDQLMAMAPMKLPARGETYTVTEVCELPLEVQATVPSAVDKYGSQLVSVAEISEVLRFPVRFFEPVLS